MRKLLIILLISLSACVKSQPHGMFFNCIQNIPAKTGFVLRGHKVDFMGNSITVGFYSSDDDHRWTTLFCAAKNAVEVNHGHSGEMVQVGSCTHQITLAIIPNYEPDSSSVLIFALGINDVGNDNGEYTADLFKTRYQQLIDNAILKGWPPDRIIVMTIYHPIDFSVYVGGCGGSVVTEADEARAEDYNTKIAELAAENGCKLIDMWTAMTGLNSSYYNADKLHPNDAGHAFIANYLISVL